jgi:hypothetical protein
MNDSLAPGALPGNTANLSIFPHPGALTKTANAGHGRKTVIRFSGIFPEMVYF